MNIRRLAAGVGLAAGFLALPAPAARAATVRVEIDRVAYAPATVSAKVGDVIEWENKDILAHTATAKGKWDIMIAPNKTGRVTLKEAGEIDYYCRFHPNMRGRIVVAPK